MLTASFVPGTPALAAPHCLQIKSLLRRWRNRELGITRAVSIKIYFLITDLKQINLSRREADHSFPYGRRLKEMR